MIQNSEQGEYNIDNVLELMNQEKFGLHISLLEQGVDPKNGKPLMSIVMDSDLNASTIKILLEGILEQYREVDSD